MLGIGQLVAGPVSDAVGRRGPLLAGCVIFVAGSVLAALSPGIGTQGGDLARVAPLVEGVIVGRTIYEARDPVTVAADLADTLKAQRGP